MLALCASIKLNWTMHSQWRVYRERERANVTERLGKNRFPICHTHACVYVINIPDTYAYNTRITLTLYQFIWYFGFVLCWFLAFGMVRVRFALYAVRACAFVCPSFQFPKIVQLCSVFRILFQHYALHVTVKVHWHWYHCARCYLKRECVSEMTIFYSRIYVKWWKI